ITRTATSLRPSTSASARGALPAHSSSPHCDAKRGGTTTSCSLRSASTTRIRGAGSWGAPGAPTATTCHAVSTRLGPIRQPLPAIASLTRTRQRKARAREPKTASSAGSTESANRGGGSSPTPWASRAAPKASSSPRRSSWSIQISSAGRFSSAAAASYVSGVSGGWRPGWMRASASAAARRCPAIASASTALSHTAGPRDSPEQRGDGVVHGGGPQVGAHVVVVVAVVHHEEVADAVGRGVLGPDRLVQGDQVTGVGDVAPRGHAARDQQRRGDEVLDLLHRQGRPGRDQQRYVAGPLPQDVVGDD